MGVTCRLQSPEGASPGFPEGGGGGSVQDFYRDADVLVTGGTGFVGKVLVEKLLRSCGTIGNVYLLMRPKKGLDVDERLEELLMSPVFNRIRCTDALKKIKAISGDVATLHLGLNHLDKKLLIDNVKIVFHAAASVRFDQDLRDAVLHNVFGTKRLLELCKKMKRLKCFVYVSTAFSNADRDCIAEKVYKPSYDPNGILAFIDFMPEEMMTMFTKRLLGKHPNTYTLTKAMAEYIVYENSSLVPSAIVRPSIITPAFKEPYSGWVDNLSGITGIVMECCRGTIRSIISDERCRMHLVPVDVVVNTLICSAWYVSTNRSGSIGVFNCTNDDSNPITWREFRSLTLVASLELPSRYVTWYPGFRYTTSRTVHVVHSVLFHLIPSALLDCCLLLMRQRPIMFKISQKFHSALLAGSFFSTNEWRFGTDNMSALGKAVRHAGANGRDFALDLGRDKFQWDEYVRTFSRGIRRYVMKDDDASLPQARRKLQRLYWFQTVIRFLLLLIFLYLLFVLFKYLYFVRT